MPIFWRYLLKHFFKIFFLCIAAFIGLGLLIRHKSFAYFIAEGASFNEAMFLAFFFLSNALPLVLGLSSLIASFLTSYRLSASSEILSLRAAGFSLTDILLPIYTVSFCITCLNFIIISELIPQNNQKIAKVRYESNTANPLVFLRNKPLKNLNYPFVEMNLRQDGEKAFNVLMIYYNQNLDRLSLFSADELTYKKSKPLRGKNLSVISYLQTDEGFDNLVIDTQKTTSSQASLFSLLTKKNPNLTKSDVFTTMGLITSNHPKKTCAIIQRISQALLPFSLSLLGASFGLFMSRRFNEKKFIPLFGCTLINFFCIFLARTSRIPITIFFLIMTLPHLIIFISAIYRQNRLISGEDR